ncbi:hypothetical protein [Streptomyces sp. MST-110588]|uniref:hypothetical protein n=1 Tax=Streptomyces sp. MST-110588 TaxID=2833628 RepID=UPI001F5DC087|nr:hypothetical protein [Streptomyces sp. MST-110588]
MASEFVGKLPCGNCHKAPMKLPGSSVGLCIRCYGVERDAQSRRAGAAGRWVSANFVEDPCMGCGSSDVDANGWLFWCNQCGMEVQVAS